MNIRRVIQKWSFILLMMDPVIWQEDGWPMIKGSTPSVSPQKAPVFKKYLYPIKPQISACQENIHVFMKFDYIQSMRNIISIYWFFSWTISISPICLNAQNTNIPNVLLILVDDLRPALGCYGDSFAISPHIDELAARSILFEKAYANQSVCAPSRFNLMLGSRSTSTGLYGFGRDFRDFYPDAITLPQYFKRHGYRTESMGKVFHVGHGTYGDEASWSVPHHSDLVVEYVDSSSTGGQLTREEALFGNKSWDFARSLPKGPAWESPDVTDTAYADGRTAQYAIQRLRDLKNHPEQPFFLAVGFARPHMPFCVPQKYWDLYDPNNLPMPRYEKAPEGAPKYAGKRDGEIVQYTPVPHSSEADPFPEELKKKLIHGYYAGVSYVDEQIGKVIRELESLNLDENTIVVLWGDHGFHLGELGIWTKHVNYEAANRIPLMIQVPSTILESFESGQRTGRLAETVDIYPTLVDLSGLPDMEIPQPVDGESLISSIENPDLEIQDHAYHCYPRGGRMGRAIRTDRYRLVEWKEIGAESETAELELYDYRSSPVEKQNIAKDRPDVVQEMRAILDEYPEALPPRPLSEKR